MISALPDSKLEALLLDPEDEKTGLRLRTLSERLGIVERTYQDIRAKAGSEFRELLIGAALGSVPPNIDEKEEKKKYKSHSQCWFKSRSGGEELAEKMFVLDAWPSLKGQLLPFCNAVRRLVRLPDLTDLP
jgi:putative ATP-dependent endonuclease of OLD family